MTEQVGGIDETAGLMIDNYHVSAPFPVCVPVPVHACPSPDWPDTGNVRRTAPRTRSGASIERLEVHGRIYLWGRKPGRSRTYPETARDRCCREPRGEMLAGKDYVVVTEPALRHRRVRGASLGTSPPGSIGGRMRVFIVFLYVFIYELIKWKFELEID